MYISLTQCSKRFNNFLILEAKLPHMVQNANMHEQMDSF
jgi:hypothetical protein